MAVYLSSDFSITLKLAADQIARLYFALSAQQETYIRVAPCYIYFTNYFFRLSCSAKILIIIIISQTTRIFETLIWITRLLEFSLQLLLKPFFQPHEKAAYCDKFI